MSKHNHEPSLWPYLRLRPKENQKLVPVERYDQEREAQAIRRQREQVEAQVRKFRQELNLLHFKRFQL